MTNGSNRVFDELAKLMTDAAGVAQGFKNEAETALQSRAERWVNNLDLVKREDFDAVKQMASLAREENDALKTRIDDLEKRLKKLETGTGKPAKRTPKDKS